MGEFDAQHLKLEEAKQLIHQMKLYYLHTNETDERLIVKRAVTAYLNVCLHEEACVSVAPVFMLRCRQWL